MAHVPLPGSERAPLSGARRTGAAGPDEFLRAVVTLRRRGSSEFHDIANKLLAGEETAPLSRRAFSGKFGGASADFVEVARFARRYGLNVAHEDAAASTLVLEGTVTQFNAAFQVELQRYRHPGGGYRGYDGPLHLPEGLQGIVTAVLGLDDRPQARTNFRFRPPFRVAPNSVQGGYSPARVAALYDFPDSSGEGQCIALIELGGGYSAEDARAYFSELDMAPPAVTVVSTDGAAHEPTGDPGGPDGEVMLDVEIAGAAAPRAHLVLYFGTNSDAGFIGAVNRAVHDDDNKPSVISISWGGPEPSWTPQSLRAFNDALKAAAMVGITVCSASGDHGAGDGLARGDHVDFPASSPYVLACGGTRLRAQGAAIESETVWNDGPQGGATGGGVSAAFELPAWQRALMVNTPQGRTALTRRGVPDVAGNADPVTGYRVRVDGSSQVVGGTSAVAPLWAALIARVNASRRRPAGYVNARLYGRPDAFNDITQGDNGGFLAVSGWDACTGLGSPNGRKVADAL